MLEREITSRSVIENRFGRKSKNGDQYVLYVIDRASKVASASLAVSKSILDESNPEVFLRLRHMNYLNKDLELTVLMFVCPL